MPGCYRCERRALSLPVGSTVAVPTGPVPVYAGTLPVVVMAALADIWIVLYCEELGMLPVVVVAGGTVRGDLLLVSLSSDLEVGQCPPSHAR